MYSFKIIHIPRYNNPYQELLLANLNKLNLDVEFGDRVGYPYLGDLSVLSNGFKNSAHILHLHWTHRYLLGHTKLRTILRSFSFIFQIILIKAFGKKVVWTAHNIRNHEGKHEKLEVFFSSILAHLVDAVIVHCQTAKRKICRAYHVRNKRKIIIIPHGNYLNVYDNFLSEEKARTRLNISSKDFAFLFLGNIRPYKGVLELIDGFKKINEKNIKLIIAGKSDDQEFTDHVKKKIEGNSNIRLILEFIDDDEIQLYMNAANVVVLPYRDILTSGAAMLAMSFGKAIIAPKIGCLGDILDEFGSFLYEQGDKNGLLNALRTSIESREKLREMGDYNLNLVRKLSWQDIATKTFKVYKKCLTG